MFIGRNPWPRAAREFAAVVDLCAELPGCAGSQAIPLLDLIPPTPESLARAATTIEQARAAGPVLVCCALGYGRSAAAVAAWLVLTGRARSVEEAADRIRRARPRVVLDRDVLAAVAQAARLA